MKVTLVQTSLVWESTQENIKNICAKIQALPEDTDLVVLPEMFTSGFTMNPERAYATMDGPVVRALTVLAQQKRVAITGSLIVQDKKRFYNRLLFIFPDGSYQTYDKRHLFSLAGEEKAYAPGRERLIVSYKGWKICPLICYDLRFPAFARNGEEAYDLLLYVASWPDQRIYAWDALLKARAIENMTYVVAVNRCGTDENNNCYSGHSQAIDPLGQYVTEPLDGEHILTIELNKANQDSIRKKFGFLNDADAIRIEGL